MALIDPNRLLGIWTFLLDHLWQATLFAFIAFATARLLRRAPARMRYAIWMIASLKFLLPSAVIVSFAKLFGLDASSLMLSLASSSSDPLGILEKQKHFFYIAQSSQNVFSYANGIVASAVLIWLTGSILFFVRWYRQQAEFRQKLLESEVVKNGREYEVLETLRARLGIKKKIQLVRVQGMIEPGVWGVWNPMIVFSDRMSSHLTDSELEAVFLHELAHVRRRDNLFSTLHMIICSLFWFHPVVWFIDRQLLAERERACDDRVIEYGGKSRIYAASLVKVLRFGLGFRVAGVSCAGGSDLKKRIEHITSSGQRKLAFLHRVVVMGLVVMLGVVSVAAVHICESQISAFRKQLSVRQAQSCPNSSISQQDSESMKDLLRSAQIYFQLTRKFFADPSN